MTTTSAAADMTAEIESDWIQSRPACGSCGKKLKLSGRDQKTCQVITRDGIRRMRYHRLRCGHRDCRSWNYPSFYKEPTRAVSGSTRSTEKTQEKATTLDEEKLDSQAGETAEDGDEDDTATKKLCRADWLGDAGVILVNSQFGLCIRYLRMLLCRVVVGKWNVHAEVNSLSMLQLLTGSGETSHELKRMGKLIRQGFWSWRLMKFLQSSGSSEVVDLHEASIDGELGRFYPRLKETFLEKWCHLKKEDQSTVVFDGGFKNHRKRCCAAGCAGGVSQGSKSGGQFCETHDMDIPPLPEDWASRVSRVMGKMDSGAYIVQLKEEIFRRKIPSESMPQPLLDLYRSGARRTALKVTVEDDQFDCAVCKDKFRPGLVQRTAGFLLAVTINGQVLDYEEMIDGETLPLRYDFISSISERLGSDCRQIIHDDACSLRRYVFAQNQANRHGSHRMKQLDYRVDRLHYRNHTGVYCATFCCPKYKEWEETKLNDSRAESVMSNWHGHARSVVEMTKFRFLWHADMVFSFTNELIERGEACDWLSGQRSSTRGTQNDA